MQAVARGVTGARAPTLLNPKGGGIGGQTF